MNGVYDVSSLPLASVTWMSQYQRSRVESKPTSWPATSTCTVDSSIVRLPLLLDLVARGKFTGVGWAGTLVDLKIGSNPHCVTYGESASSGSAPSVALGCQHTTPSRS